MKKIATAVLLVASLCIPFAQTYAYNYTQHLADLARTSGSVLGDSTTAVPTGLIVTASGTNTMLSWTPVAGDVASYKIYRNGVLITQTTGTTYTDTATGTPTYAVAAVNASGSFESAQSLAASAMATYQTTATVNVRSSASTSGSIVGKEAAGSTGTTVAGSSMASAYGYQWVNLAFANGTKGWVAMNNVRVTGGMLSQAPTSVTAFIKNLSSMIAVLQANGSNPRQLAAMEQAVQAWVPGTPDMVLPSTFIPAAKLATGGSSILCVDNIFGAGSLYVLLSDGAYHYVQGVGSSCSNSYAVQSGWATYGGVYTGIANKSTGIQATKIVPIDYKSAFDTYTKLKNSGTKNISFKDIIAPQGQRLATDLPWVYVACMTPTDDGGWIGAGEGWIDPQGDDETIGIGHIIMNDGDYLLCFETTPGAL